MAERDSRAALCPPPGSRLDGAERSPGLNRTPPASRGRFCPSSRRRSRLPLAPPPGRLLGAPVLPSCPPAAPRGPRGAVGPAAGGAAAPPPQRPAQGLPRVQRSGDTRSLLQAPPAPSLAEPSGTGPSGSIPSYLRVRPARLR